MIVSWIFPRSFIRRLICARKFYSYFDWRYFLRNRNYQLFTINALIRLVCNAKKELFLLCHLILKKNTIFLGERKKRVCEFFTCQNLLLSVEYFICGFLVLVFRLKQQQQQHDIAFGKCIWSGVCKRAAWCYPKSSIQKFWLYVSIFRFS